MWIISNFKNSHHQSIAFEDRMMSQLLTVVFIIDSYMHVLHISESDTHVFKAAVYINTFIKLLQLWMFKLHDVHSMFELKKYSISQKQCLNNNS